MRYTKTLGSVIDTLFDLKNRFKKLDDKMLTEETAYVSAAQEAVNVPFAQATQYIMRRAGETVSAVERMERSETVAEATGIYETVKLFNNLLDAYLKQHGPELNQHPDLLARVQQIVDHIQKIVERAAPTVKIAMERYQAIHADPVEANGTKPFPVVPVLIGAVVAFFALR